MLVFIAYSNLKIDSLSSALKKKVELKTTLFNLRRKQKRGKREEEKEMKAREKIRVCEEAFEKERKERKGKLISSALC